MSDVLTAAASDERVIVVRDALRWLKGHGYKFSDEANAALTRLARSHEQLGEEVKALERMGRSYNDLWRQEKERAEASARAAGSATDALRRIAALKSIYGGGSGVEPQFRTIAREALAVLGHATPAADEERQA